MKQSESNSTQLRIDVEDRGTATVVTVHGSVGIQDAERLRESLEELTDRHAPLLVLDLSDMDFICSLGLGAMINAHLQSRHHGGRIRLVNPQEPIRDLLETTRLTRLFEIYGDVEQALAE